MSNKIGIVTVLYKSENVLPEFFESLAKQTFRNFVLYVVDNLSPDNSLQVTYDYQKTSNFPMVVIPNDDNYGVAKGNNIGIKQALADGCDYVLLSNNDVTFEAPTIYDLYNSTFRLNAFIMVPKIYFHGTNLIWFAGGEFVKRSGWTKHYSYKQVDKSNMVDCTKTGYAPTCFMLIQKTVFEQIGYMDEKYFVYWDDSDFVFRAIKDGFKLWYTPAVTINHKESTSTQHNSDFFIHYTYRNFIYFTLKNRNLFQTLYILTANIIFHFTKNYFLLTRRQWKVALNAYIEGIKLYCKNNK